MFTRMSIALGDGRGRDEHGIHPPAEPRDVELEVDPRGGDGCGISAWKRGAWHRFREVGQGGAEHGQLQSLRGELLRGERVAVRACQRRVDLVVRGAEERSDRVGVEGGVEAWAGRAESRAHGGQPTKPGGQPWSLAGLTKTCTLVHTLSKAEIKDASMPRKIRDLVRDLVKAGFEERRGKGSHRNFNHHALAEVVTISGRDGEDAKPYIEQAVRKAIDEVSQWRRATDT
jgi:predicted RNA binding protein YcfA (HicA-like mRNA interferase family)